MNIDANVIKRCKRKEKTAFVELFQFYERYLYTVCYSYVQSEQDALDLVQEIYIKLLRHIQTYDEKLPFHPWVRKIAVNSCLNFRRDRGPKVVPLHFTDSLTADANAIGHDGAPLRATGSSSSDAARSHSTASLDDAVEPSNRGDRGWSRYPPDSDVEESALRHERRDIVRAELKNLPENYRLMIALRYFENLSYQEIATLLDKPLGTVKTDLYRAKLLLKKRLSPKLEG